MYIIIWHISIKHIGWRFRIRDYAPAAKKKNTEVKKHEKNIPAQEDPETEGARLQKKNENRERTQGSREKTREGQKNLKLLSMGEFSKGYLTIKKDREFRFLFGKGQTCVNYAFVCYFKENRRRRNRCGIVTGKKIGNAVVRNRARRVIREAFRIFDHELTGRTEKRYDFVFVARGQTAAQKSQKLLRLMETRLMPMLGSGASARETKKPKETL